MKEKRNLNRVELQPHHNTRHACGLSNPNKYPQMCCQFVTKLIYHKHENFRACAVVKIKN